MKQITIIISIMLLCCHMGMNAANGEQLTESIQQEAQPQTSMPIAQTSDDAKVMKALKKYIKGNDKACRLSAQAKEDLVESTWPEVYCSVSNDLASPSDFKKLVVRKVGDNLYKYECVCPEHGDRYVDCCTVEAVVCVDGVVQINHVIWDGDEPYTEDTPDEE